MGRPKKPYAYAAMLAVLVLAACAPQTPSGTERSSAPSERPAANAAPKVLTMVGTEGVVPDFPGAVGRTNASAWGFIHDYLTVRNDQDEFVAGLAAEQLSVDNGTWRINPDGSMDTIWKLRPNIKWHDGTPFTSDDLLFTFNTYKDPELPSRYNETLKRMESAAAVDPLTFTMHWNSAYSRANEAPALNPMPRHILESVYQSDRTNFANHNWFSSEFIGLGAYRISRWEAGTFVELERFDDYYRGRPPLDRVIVKFIKDPNAVVTNLLAGSLDIAWGDRLNLESSVEVGARWQGTGNQARFTPLADLMQVEIQHRVEYARPVNGLTNQTVRQAFYHAIDRQAIVDSVMHGLAPLADSYLGPNHVLRRQLEAGIPQYPYDPAKAQQLLASAGWTRGADGVLVSRDAGQPFDITLGVMEIKDERQMSIVADQWKAIGARVSQYAMPRPRDREAESIFSGGVLASPKAYEIPYESRFYSGNIATAANRWTGRDRGGYVNPAVDAALDQLSVVIDPRATLEGHRQLLLGLMTDIAHMPVYFDVNPILMVKGVKGPIGGTSLEWNFYEWDKEA